MVKATKKSFKSSNIEAPDNNAKNTDMRMDMLLKDDVEYQEYMDDL